MRRNGSVKPVGCHDKFHHIVKQNVIGSARTACLCFSVKWGRNLSSVGLKFPCI